MPQIHSVATHPAFGLLLLMLGLLVCLPAQLGTAQMLVPAVDAQGTATPQREAEFTFTPSLFVAPASLLVRLDLAAHDVVQPPPYARLVAQWYVRPASFWSVERVALGFLGLLVISLLGAWVWHYRSVVQLNRHLAAVLAEVQHQRAMVERTEQIASIGSWEWDVEQDRVTWSAELFHIFRLDPTQPAPQFPQLVHLFHLDDHAALLAAVQRALDTGQPYELELRALRSDGVQRMCLAYGHVLQADADGKATRLCGSLHDVTERKWYEDALHTSAQQLRSLSRRLLEAHERERRAIARELHDEVGQVLTGLKLTLSTAALDAPASLSASLSDARGAISELLARVRALTLDLRPALLDDLGLLPALGWFLDRYVPRTGVQVDLRHSGIERRFPTEIETTAYRTIQEALTNVARHAGVLQAKVRIFANAEHLVVQVSDEGLGFASEAALASQMSGGLSGMRERIELIGGTLSIEAQPGEGTEITAELPLPPDEA